MHLEVDGLVIEPVLARSHLTSALVLEYNTLIHNKAWFTNNIPTVVVLQGESACTQPCEQQMVCESVQLCERSVMCQSDESEAALIFCLVMVHRCDYTH